MPLGVRARQSASALDGRPRIETSSFPLGPPALGHMSDCFEKPITADDASHRRVCDFEIFEILLNRFLFVG